MKHDAVPKPRVITCAVTTCKLLQALHARTTCVQTVLTFISKIVVAVLAEDLHVLTAREAYSDSVLENRAESRLSGGRLGALVVAVAKERLLI